MIVIESDLGERNWSRLRFFNHIIVDYFYKSKKEEKEVYVFVEASVISQRANLISIVRAVNLTCQRIWRIIKDESFLLLSKKRIFFTFTSAPF